MICLYCKDDDVRADDPWVPVAYLGKQQGWTHQSCEPLWKEQQRAHDAAIASAERKLARDIATAAAERKVRIKRFARIATMAGVFLFLLWLGWSAIAGAAKDAMFSPNRYQQEPHLVHTGTSTGLDDLSEQTHL